MENVQQK